MSPQLNKKCEVCQAPIPDDFGNLLCMQCYEKTTNSVSVSGGIQVNESGISDPEYQENPEVPEIDMVTRAHGRFKGTGWIMPESQIVLYKALKDWIRNECVTKNVQFPKFIWKPKAVDVGSGLGIGTNILSQECDYILGIDKNEENVRWSEQMFKREKNNIYWSPQIDFMFVDVVTDTREFMKFDMVFCIEVIEHLKEFKPLFEFLKKLVKPNGIVWISTPNRAAWAGEPRSKTPLNLNHVREYTSDEFKQLLESNGFNNIEMYNCNLEPALVADTPVIAKCHV